MHRNSQKKILKHLVRMSQKAKNFLMLFLLVLILSGSALTFKNKDAHALCTPCVSCSIIDTFITVAILEFTEDVIWEPVIEDNIEDHLNSEENWIVEEFFEEYWVKALAELTEFLSAFGMYQVEMIGTFFDAKNNLKTQRLFSKLQAEAHKDYHPSDDFCWFGTNTRSLAASERFSHLTMLVLSNRSLERQLGDKSAASGPGIETDKKSRWNQFIKTYCDPKDNGWFKDGTGLDLACDHDGDGGAQTTGAQDRGRVNRDLDYTSLIDEPRTLEIDFSDNTTPVPADEEDVLAMAANLYGHNTPSRGVTYEKLKDRNSGAARAYLNLRSVAAKRNVAEHSFHALVAMKSSKAAGSSGASQPDVGLYMASIMKDLMPEDTSDEDIFALLGKNPSYYAQLEILGKKIYQNPQFFANLYDKPANVKRKGVAMKAIALMLDRALFESELRQEMLLSVMLSSTLNEKYKAVNPTLKSE